MKRRRDHEDVRRERSRQEEGTRKEGFVFSPASESKEGVGWMTSSRSLIPLSISQDLLRETTDTIFEGKFPPLSLVSN